MIDDPVMASHIAHKAKARRGRVAENRARTIEQFVSDADVSGGAEAGRLRHSVAWFLNAIDKPLRELTYDDLDGWCWARAFEPGATGIEAARANVERFLRWARAAGLL